MKPPEIMISADVWLRKWLTTSDIEAQCAPWDTLSKIIASGDRDAVIKQITECVVSAEAGFDGRGLKLDWGPTTRIGIESMADYYLEQAARDKEASR